MSDPLSSEQRDDFIIHHELRFVMREGKRILQQKWTRSHYPRDNSPVEHFQWRDVPLVETNDDI